LPNASDVLALEPEELAGVLVVFLNSQTASDLGKLHRRNFALAMVQGYPEEVHASVGHALMEAWSWLVREGVVAPRLDNDWDWVFLARRGRSLKSAHDFAAFRKTKALPRDVLHPAIAERTLPAFMRGEYDTAVFQAFREVEVAVRNACGLGPEALGVDLMRKAFAVDGAGPLCDPEAVRAEQQAVSDLFAGAMDGSRTPEAIAMSAWSRPARPSRSSASQATCGVSWIH
jgi:uncharacterized protein (TIGR02391 family)